MKRRQLLDGCNCDVVILQQLSCAVMYRHHRELIVLQRDLKQRLGRNADAPGMYRAIQNKADEVAAEIKVRGFALYLYGACANAV